MNIYHLPRSARLGDFRFRGSGGVAGLGADRVTLCCKVDTAVSGFEDRLTLPSCNENTADVDDEALEAFFFAVATTLTLSSAL
jgi:hypothetical protein